MEKWHKFGISLASIWHKEMKMEEIMERKERKEKKIQKYQEKIYDLKFEISMMEMRLNSALWLEERGRIQRQVARRKKKCEKLVMKVEVLKK